MLFPFFLLIFKLSREGELSGYIVFKIFPVPPIMSTALKQQHVSISFKVTVGCPNG